MGTSLQHVDPILQRLPRAAWATLPAGLGVGLLLSLLLYFLLPWIGVGAGALLANACLLAICPLVHRLQDEVTMEASSVRWCLLARKLLVVLIPPTLMLTGGVVFLEGEAPLWVQAAAIGAVLAACLWYALQLVTIPLFFARPEANLSAVLRTSIFAVVRRPIPLLGAVAGILMAGSAILKWQPPLAALLPLLVATLSVAAAWPTLVASGVRPLNLVPLPADQTKIEINSA